MLEKNKSIHPPAARIFACSTVTVGTVFFRRHDCSCGKRYRQFSRRSEHSVWRLFYFTHDIWWEQYRLLCGNHSRKPASAVIPYDLLARIPRFGSTVLPKWRLWLWKTVKDKYFSVWSDDTLCNRASCRHYILCRVFFWYRSLPWRTPEFHWQSERSCRSNQKPSAPLKTSETFIIPEAEARLLLESFVSGSLLIRNCKSSANASVSDGNSNCIKHRCRIWHLQRRQTGTDIDNR